MEDEVLSEFKEIEIPPSYQAFKVAPHKAEIEDNRIPKDLAESLRLFLQTGNQVCGQRLCDCLDNLLKLLAEGPDGKNQISIGRGIICWGCGYVGLPKNMDELSPENEDLDDIQRVKAICQQCNSGNDTNFVDGMQPDGSTIPFIECNSSTIAHLSK